MLRGSVKRHEVLNLNKPGLTRGDVVSSLKFLGGGSIISDFFSCFGKLFSYLDSENLV